MLSKQRSPFPHPPSESNICDCGQNEDTSRHLLLECQRWEEKRKVLRPKVGNRWGDLSYMLGGWNSWKDRRGNTLDGAQEKWKPVIPIVRAVAQFVLATGNGKHSRKTLGQWTGKLKRDGRSSCMSTKRAPVGETLLTYTQTS